MMIKGRIKEIYILRSIGITKKDVLLQFIFEGLFVVIIAFLIAMLITAVFMGGIGELVESIVLPESENSMDYIISDANGPVEIDPVIKSAVDLEYTFSPWACLFSACIGVSAVLLSCGFSSKRILNKPLNMLKNEIR